ncbi:Crp/Fnr family transcriptional regulator [Bacillus sp. FJAT-27225]|uniref:Crp/Fnr family transcriptional regulator n=1 Tax=Bacillus sp. FJAT-27225 TaxID=1743144 RepID=UPI00080C33CC|nr:Crp/Fnr family transcriptional regulator [Bacillus sp. FJAT-27225]OCA88055.1 Crp/Fnr family transcriptional regulator [Bacillus sp. FJAT-27225]
MNIVQKNNQAGSSCGAGNGGHCTHHGHTHKPCIAQVPIFNHLEPSQMDEIMNAVRPAFYKKGEIVYHAGDKSDSLYIVHKGKVKIYRLSESGKEQLVRILNPGDFTGELALFSEGIHESFAEAMLDTEACMISREDLQQYLLKYPKISLEILAEFSSRLEQSEKQTTRTATEKVETRIALFLAECLEDGARPHEFKLPMSRKDLASYLGTTPETISRKLAEFEDAGLILQKPKKRIEILDLDGLLLV